MKVAHRPELTAFIARLRAGLQAEFGNTFKELLNCNLDFQPRKVLPQATVRPNAERGMNDLRSPDIEYLGFRTGIGVARGGGEIERDPVPGFKGNARDFYVCLHGAGRGDHRRVKAGDFFYGVGHIFRVGQKVAPDIRVGCKVINGSRHGMCRRGKPTENDV